MDADSRTVRARRPASAVDSPDAPHHERMQCAALALPSGQAGGPAPVPALLDDVPAYRLSGRTADGQPAVFWLDAGDWLVCRIDRVNGDAIWLRGALDRELELGDEVFHPEALTNL